MKVLLPALALTALAAGALLALYAVVPGRSASIVQMQAQHLAAPLLSSVRESEWRPFKVRRRLQRLPGTVSQFAALRFEFQLAKVPPEPLAMFIPAYDSSLAAYLNDHFIGEAGSVTPPVAVNAYHPALFRLRPADLHEGRNVVQLIVGQAIAGIGIVHAVYIGELPRLERAWNWTTFASVDVLRIYNGLFLVLGIFAILVYRHLRLESVFLWFVLLIFFCGLRNLDMLFTQWPESQRLRAMLVMGSSLGILLSCTGFVNRLGGRRARLDRWLLLSMPPLLALFWWRSGTDLIAAIDEAYAVLRLVFVLVVPLMLWRLAAVARRLPSWRLGWVLGCLCMAIIFVGHDAVVMWATPALDYQYSLLASMPMVSAFLIAVAHRYIENVRALERSHAQLLAERQRIMRDMHDGVGGQLTSLIMKLRRTHADAELTRQVESSLSDLRLIIDSLDEVTTADLRTALGSFRQRIEPWLRQHAVELDWKMDLPPTGGYGAQETLQLLRILQEACSNVIKHAGADRLQITIGMEPGDAATLISIVDNGHGFAAQSTASGRGLEIMRQRAQALHGELAIESSASGTALRIRLPPPDAAIEAPAGR